MRLRHNAVSHPGVRRPHHDRIEKSGRVDVVESPERELGQTGPIAVVGRIAHRYDKQDRLGQQATCDECDRLH